MGCAIAPLLALVMPAVGAGARDRVYPGDPTGGQMTVFPVSCRPPSCPASSARAGGLWWVTVLSVVPVLTLRLLQRRGTALLDTMASRDAVALRSTCS
ncbi:hypothetical protein [Streptosporangium sp. CA-115845]|uniref:hypothetical protein n=1 Tax=Streptosporangium sp. CA-115845 TaxID=3240071 RepID=UPI003D9167F5